MVWTGTGTPATPSITVLQKTFQNLYEEVGGYLKNDRTLATAADKVECKRIANDGYLMFVSERDWSFLSPQTSIVIWGDTAGTVSGTPTTTVVTAAAFFRPSMIGHTVTIGTGTYTISAVASTTSATITSSASSQGAAPAISIAANGQYKLPATFGQLIDRFSFDTSNPYPPILPLAPQSIRDKWSLTSGTTGWPVNYAVQPLSFTTTTGQEWEALFYPIPDQNYTLYYRYRVNVLSMTDDAEYPIGGPKHSLAIQQAALAVAEATRGDVSGPQRQKYDRLLARSIERDNEDRPRNLGYNGDKSDQYSNWLSRTTVIQTLSTS